MGERLLILNVSGIGDFIDSTLALRYARKLRPSANIVLLVSEKALPLARSCPYVDKVIGLPTASGKSIPALADLGRWIGRVRGLRGQFDTAINLYGVASTPGAWGMRFLLNWSGARTTIGSNAGGLAPFYTRRIETGETSPDQIERSLRIVSLLNSAVESAGDRKPELWIPQSIMDAARHRVENIEGYPVAVFLGGERRTRHESPARAEAWLTRIQAHFPIHPILIGTASDPGLPPASTVRHLDLRGKSTLEETAAIIAASRCLITTHSSPQHFASVWNVPTVVLVGPGDAARYRPHVSEERLRLLRHPVPCSPCYYQDCPLPGAEKQKCMTGISVESIARAFSEVCGL